MIGDHLTIEDVPIPKVKFERTRLVSKLRKPQKCNYCGDVIKVGERAVYQSGFTTECDSPSGYYRHEHDCLRVFGTQSQPPL